ncbi:VOC family protein [Pseudomonas sp. St316]|uniref:VOC family protein n=1 Tax=Pseudomonas sp. St316 TaxID=2678257 RepID=UPI001BB36429|nr:VOC family protein [Pseudomonas sp. St316]BBP57399.1 drug:proton antiporter [Pseudomonas sp. St316]
MIKPNFFILYVDSPETSASFYADLLGSAPVEASATFAMFALDSGFMLGLWSKHTVEPRVACIGVAGEVAFSVAEKAVVDSTYQAWMARGLTVIQTPVDMDFGYTFVVLDPDGHRLRVFAASNT